MDLNKFAIGSKLNNAQGAFSAFGNDRLVSISNNSHTFFYSLPRLVAVSDVFEFAATLPDVVAVLVGD